MNPEQENHQIGGQPSGFLEGFLMERLQTKERKKLAYNCQSDIDSFNRLKNLEGKIEPADYAQQFLSWYQETQINLETNLGERYNAQMFEVNYPIKNGRILNPFREKPFLDNIVEGQQDYLGESRHLNHNQKRELAEVIAFSAVEGHIMDSPNANFINPSPPGGDYEGNFIDIFNLEKEDGKDFVQIRRFAVSTPKEDHWRIAQKLTGNALDNQTPPEEQDVVLKEIVIKTTKTAKDLLNLYIPDQNALSLEGYEKLKVEYKPWTKNYIEAIMNNCSLSEAEDLYENSLKFADFKTGKAIDKTGTVNRTSTHSAKDIPHLNLMFIDQPLRPVSTGCGFQGRSTSRDLLSTTIYNLNLTEFSSSEKTLCCTCPFCNTPVEAKIAGGEISCPNCKKSAPYKD